MVVLSKCKGQNLSEEQASELSPSEKRALMTTNPVVTARHFAHRFQCHSREVIKGTGQPIGEVLDFFWRIEFQLRGSPHVHSMWWIKDPPNLDTASGRQVAPQYMDRYISVGIPKESGGNSENWCCVCSSTIILLCTGRQHIGDGMWPSVALISLDLFVRKHV